jgi:hypothetical protein
MDECDPIDDELDWLTGEFTYKRENLRRAINSISRDDFYE